MKLSLGLACLTLCCLSCRTNDGGSPPSPGPEVGTTIYDGSSESMDTLPDCSADMVGSQFWVREVKTGYECTNDGQWASRGHDDPDAPR